MPVKAKAKIRAKTVKKNSPVKKETVKDQRNVKSNRTVSLHPKISSSTISLNILSKDVSPMEILKRDMVRIRTNVRRNKKEQPPIFFQDGKPIIFRNTVNIIKGKKGTHKSRYLANFIISAIADESISIDSYLKMECQEHEPDVLLIDTERNIASQLPNAIKSMYRLAGVDIRTGVENFTPASLINIPRKERMELVQQYIMERRQTIPDEKHMLIFCDVFTDFVTDFNSGPSAFEFIDFFNSLADQYNATVIGIIHENPSNDKARGHIGTELENKATTIIQIKRAKENNEGHPILEVIIEKLREDALPPRKYVTFCNESKNLKLTEEPLSNVVGLMNPADTIIYNVILDELSDGRSIQLFELKEIISKMTDMKGETIGKKLSSWNKNGQTFNTEDGLKVLSRFKTAKGEVMYKLINQMFDENESQEEKDNLETEE